jgi:protein-S-isoprenylcysteine O-methyltransferase Ste14
MKNKIVEILYKKRVFLGFVFGFCFIFFSRPSSIVALILGLMIAIFGEVIRLVASGFIIKTDELSTEGPYSIVRHPLYFGSFVMGLGLCLSIFSIHHIVSAVIFFVAFLVLFFGVYIPVLKKEEEVLIAKYGDKYLDYKANVPMLFPKLCNYVSNCNSSSRCGCNSGYSYSKNNSKKFDKKIFMNNKEYRALMGLIAIMFILFAKYIFISIYGS